MKVGLYVADYTADMGGGFTFQSEILRWLPEVAVDSRHSFVILSRSAGRAGAAPFPVVPCRLPGRLDHLRRAVSDYVPARSRKRFLATQFDLQLQRAGVQFVWFAGVPAVGVDTPYLTTVWDLQHRLQPWFPEVSGGGEYQQREAMYSNLLRRAAFVVVGTEAGRAEVATFYSLPPERIRKLPQPTPKFALEPVTGDDASVLAGYGLKPGYLFYPAQFWAHKNHVNLLLAVCRLRDEHNLALQVVFSGADQGNLAHVMRVVQQLDLVEQTHTLGFVPQAHLVALYRQALALTFVTFFGPDNLPPLEAFALGCPVIASKVVGSEEQLGNAAELVDPKDPQAIADAVVKLYHQPELRQTLIDRGRARAARWTGRDYVAGVVQLLDEFEPYARCWSNS